MMPSHEDSNALNANLINLFYSLKVCFPKSPFEKWNRIGSGKSLPSRRIGDKPLPEVSTAQFTGTCVRYQAFQSIQVHIYTFGIHALESVTHMVL